MDAKTELTKMLKGFTSHHKSNELVFKNAQKKKGYKGSDYPTWLQTRITYWTRHYNQKYSSDITIGEAKLIYDELPKNFKPETIQLKMKG